MRQQLDLFELDHHRTWASSTLAGVVACPYCGHGRPCDLLQRQRELELWEDDSPAEAWKNAPCG